MRDAGQILTTDNRKQLQKGKGRKFIDKLEVIEATVKSPGEINTLVIIGMSCLFKCQATGPP